MTARLPTLTLAFRWLASPLMGLVLAAPLLAHGQAFKLPGASAGPAAAVVTTNEVRAELLVHAPQGITAGQPVWLGLQLAHQPEWHTYWKNSGDSGLPTQLEWILPAGVSAGEIAWPTPKKIPIGNLANYGYENTVLLPVPLTVLPQFKGEQLDVRLKASWLICKKECIPQEGEFALKVPAKGSSAFNAQAFDSALATRPRDVNGGASQIAVAGSALQVSLTGLPANLQGKLLEFFPETGGVIEPAGRWTQAWQGAVWTAEVPLAVHRSESPARMPVVVALAAPADKAAAGQGWRIDVPVTGEWPALAAPVQVSAALQEALNSNLSASAPTASVTAAPWPTLLAALLGALVGGLILNLMPCVFPVLAVKMVSFVKEHDQRTRVASGLAYTAGVVLSFLALGGLLLALRAAGEQLGWGFQLQNPAVVASLAALFTLLGLNLAGLFEFGQLLPGRVASLQARNPTVNSFLTGVLATAIASPCTAPFMGASLGLAVGLPAAQALAVFGAIGLGMALPYLLASLVPAVARLLPRPGAWMVTFRKFMAFPMFATVVWLVWVLGQQVGIDGAGALLGLLVLLAFAIWTFTLAGRSRHVAGSAAALLTALGVWAAMPVLLAEPASTQAQSLGSTTGNPVERWQPWAPGKVEQLNARGQSVMVDFTAAWCVTCQYNKKTTLANDDVLADVDAKNVALLRADWTRRDPDVTAALQKLGRSGVPVYVIYKPGNSPVVLSEILSVEDVRRELAKL
jgi:thiol:disulfide interchange protein